MGFLSSLFGKMTTTDVPEPAAAGQDFFGAVIDIPSRKFTGLSTKSLAAVTRFRGATEGRTRSERAAITCSIVDALWPKVQCVDRARCGRFDNFGELVSERRG
jgi:hypothetical protein